MRSKKFSRTTNKKKSHASCGLWENCGNLLVGKCSTLYPTLADYSHYQAYPIHKSINQADINERYVKSFIITYQQIQREFPNYLKRHFSHKMFKDFGNRSTFLGLPINTFLLLEILVNLLSSLNAFCFVTSIANKRIFFFFNTANSWAPNSDVELTSNGVPTDLLMFLELFLGGYCDSLVMFVWSFIAFLNILVFKKSSFLSIISLLFAVLDCGTSFARFFHRWEKSNIDHLPFLVVFIGMAVFYYVLIDVHWSFTRIIRAGGTGWESKNSRELKKEKLTTEQEPLIAAENQC